MLETPSIRRYSLMSHPLRRIVTLSSDNPIGADNQQERLDAYLAGFVDGEGSFHVAIQRNPSTRAGWQLVPEFHVSQNPERRQVLDLLQGRLGCGHIRENHRGSTRHHAWCSSCATGSTSLEQVIPFFEAPAASQHQSRSEFLTFRSIVHGDGGRASTWTLEGFEALKANGAHHERRRPLPAGASIG